MVDAVSRAARSAAAVGACSPEAGGARAGRARVDAGAGGPFGDFEGQPVEGLCVVYFPAAPALFLEEEEAEDGVGEHDDEDLRGARVPDYAHVDLEDAPEGPCGVGLVGVAGEVDLEAVAVGGGVGPCAGRDVSGCMD